MNRHIVLPSGIRMKSLKGNVVNNHVTAPANIHGSGVGSVLLDGGQGGQSSYSSLKEYKETTKGYGLSDRIGSKLKDLSILTPSGKRGRKNIKLDF